MFNLRTASMASDDITEAKAALNEAFREYKSIGALQADPQFVHKAAVLLRKIARNTFETTDQTQLFFDVQAGPGLGNRLELEDWVNTAKVTVRSLGGKTKAYTPHKLKYSVSLTDYQIAMDLQVEKVLTGQMDASILGEQMGEAIQRHHIKAGFDAIDTACGGSVLDYYGQNVRTTVGGALSAPALDTALKRLGDVNPNVTIAGRFSALYPMLGFSGYSDAALEEIRKNGAIGTYKGAQVVVLRDSYNPFYNVSAVPNTRVYLVGGDKGGTLFEEDMSLLDFETVNQEENNIRVGTKLRKTFAVFKPWKYHVLVVS